MKKITNFVINLIKVGLLAGVLSICISYSTAKAADVVTANLKAVPMNASPGSKIKFQATVFNNPAFYAKPDEMVQILVTRNDFSWITEKRNIKYPGSGVLTIDFTEQFTIPADAKAGDVFNFILTNKIWWPISQQVTVKVTGLQLKRKNFIRKCIEFHHYKRKIP